MQKYLSLLCLILAFCLGSLSQNNRIDSLEYVLLRSPEDTNKVNLLIDLANELKNNNPAKALEYGNKGLQLAKDEDYSKGIAQSNYILGQIQYNQGNYEEALNSYSDALKILTQIASVQPSNQENKLSMAKCYSGIGNIHFYKANFEKALSFYIKSLKINEETGNKTGIAGAALGVGNVYNAQGNYDKALDYYFQSLSIRRVLERQNPDDVKNKQAMAGIYTNMCGIYIQQKSYEMALDYAQKAVQLYEQTGDKYGLASAYTNLSTIYSEKNDSKLSLEIGLKSIEIKKELDDKYGIATSYINIGGEYSKLKNFQEALKYINLGYEIAKEIGAKDLIKECYGGYANLYASMNDYKQAFNYFLRFSTLKDTLFTEESTRQMAEVQTQYETDKKQKEIEMLKKDGQIKQLEVERQKTFRNSFIGGFGLILVLAFVIYNRYRLKQKANVLLSEQNEIIKKKNKDITDSINYARRIQQAILPDMEQLKSKLPHSFLLYLPKDIVSGDFYFYAEKNNKIILSAVDCTGHGVPGAFMSMIGSDQLNHIILEKGITRPSDILVELNKGIKKALKQSDHESESRDGMDLALCSIDLVDKTIEFAGAHRPLYLIRSNELTEIKSDKVAIGGTTDENHQFSNHEVKGMPGDTVYIFSDGYHDQFGGVDKRKFMTKRFKELLLSIQDKPMKEQRDMLQSTIESWRGALQQLDDILVIGIKV